MTKTDTKSRGTSKTWLLLLLSMSLSCTCLRSQPSFPPAAEMHEAITKLDSSGHAKLESGDYPAAYLDFKQAFEYAQELARLYKEDAEYGPIYREQSFLFLERCGFVFIKLGDDVNALKTMEPAAAGYAEIADREKTPERKQFAATMLGRLAWLQLKNNQPVAAEKNALKALDYDSTQLFLEMNLAHALLLNGKTADAFTSYTVNSQKKLDDGRLFQTVVLEDFAEMEKVGVTSPGFNAVREIYGAPAVKAPSPKKKTAPLIVWSIVAGIFAFIGGLFWLFYYLEKKRVEKVLRLVSSWGWTYREKGTPQDLLLIHGTHLASRGRLHYVGHLIELPAGPDQPQVFDARFTQGHGKSTQTFTQTVISIVSDKLAGVPSFVLTPESIFDKVVSAFGYKDINFQENPVFSKKYKLTGADEPAIRQFFAPDIIDFFEKEPGWTVEILNGRIYIYRENVRAKPDQLQAFIEKRREIFKMLVG